MTPSLLAAGIVVATMIIGLVGSIVVAQRTADAPARAASPIERRTVQLLIVTAAAMTVLIVALTVATSTLLD
jgi:hypothetical protein